MSRMFNFVLLLAAMLAAGCTSLGSLNTTGGPKATRTNAVRTTAEAERIVLQQFEDPSKVRIVGTRLYEEEGFWYVLASRLPATPGAHTGFKVRAADGAIIESIGGL